MPEIKHNFTGGKMNKDLDERLVKNGEYRDAMNIQVSTSEGSDVGTAQNILGNSLINGQEFIPSTAKCVGSIADEKNDKLYYFIINKVNLASTSNATSVDDGVFLNSIDKITFTPNAGTDYVAPIVSASELTSGKTYIASATISEYEDLDLTIANTIGFSSQGGLSAAIGDSRLIGNGVIYHEFVSDGNSVRVYAGDQVGAVMSNISIFDKEDIMSFIVEYDSTTNTITPVVVDANVTVLSFDPNVLITGVNIIDDMLFWTDNYSEPKKINIPRCIEGTDSSGTIHTKLINKSRDYDIYSNIDLQEEHITVIRKSPKIAPTIELLSGQIAGLTYGGVMKITSDPGDLTAGGSNPQNLSSFIFPSNQYYDFSQFSIGSQFSTRIETDLQGDSGFDLGWDINDTVVLKEFGGNNYDEVPSSPITNYSIKAKVIDVIHPNDDVTELAPNGDFTLPNVNGSRPLGYTWGYSAVTYESGGLVSGILQPPKIVVDNADNWKAIAVGDPNLDFVYGNVAAGQPAGTYKVKIEVGGITAGTDTKVYVVAVSDNSTGTIYNWHTQTNGGYIYSDGIYEFNLTLDTNTSTGVSGTAASIPGKFFVRTGSGSNTHSFEILNISIERQDVSDAQVKLEITGFEGTPPATPPNYTELRYAVEKLNEEEKLFEYKFPRFAYRYQYEDKEYSTFSPFTQVAFLPGSFDYHPRNAYNLGMINNVNEIRLSGFIPTAILDGEGQDIVAVDILYKDEASSNVYVVDTIKNNQHDSDIWANNQYTIKSEIIKRILPSNQLLRPWDAVPKKALAQEVSGNRVVYANYTQGFDLVKPGTKQEYYPNLNVSLSSEYQGLSTVKSIKSLREYQLGVVFVDKYGRETPVLSNSTGDQKIAKKDSNKSNKLKVSFAGTMFPKDLKYFKFFIKETSGEYYNMSMDRWWDAGDGLAWLSFPSSDINKIDIDTFLILKKGVGSNDLVEDKARYKVLAIETEAPDFIKTNKILLEEKTQIFTSNDNSLFGNTINNAPLLGRDSFDINFQPFADSAGSELHNVKEQEGVLYIEFAIGDGTSDRYRISEITQPSANIADAKYHIKLDKKLGDDINFICDDPSTGLSPTKIVDNTIVRIYKYLPENSSEFDGRFFVKVNKDDVFNSNVYAETVGSTSYRVSVSKKLYYMGSNQALLHHKALTNHNAGVYGGTSLYAPGSSSSYLRGGLNSDLNFGSFASFFRNYKWESVTVQSGSGDDIGQYRFDDTNQTDWERELRFTGVSAANSSYPSPTATNIISSDLKKADHSGFDNGERYGVFNNKGEQEKGNVWFIDGGPYSGERTDADSLHWAFIHMTNGNEQGLVQGNQSSSMIIAMGGIYHGKENHIQDMQNDSHKTEEFFNIGRDNGNPYYNSTQFKDLVGKISPSVKFRFREDPNGEIYTIQPSGVNHHRRLRWSDGSKQGPSSGEYPAWTSTDEPQAAQLSPNFSMGYKTTFKNSNGDGDINWDPTNGGTTGPIDGGLKLTVQYGSTALTLNANQLFVSNIHDRTCSVNGGKHSITKGMILTKYGSQTLSGTFDQPNAPAFGGTTSTEPLIVSNIDDVSGGFILTLAGYSSPLFLTTPNTAITALSLKIHQITNVSPAIGNSLVFQQPAMNGYSQYSVNRINVEDPNNEGFSLENPGILAVGYNIEFLEEIETESEFPSNPAIWETEPKETTDLDIYYEASGYNPLTLTEDNKYVAIPIGSSISHNGSLSSIIDGTTVRGVHLFDGSTQSPTQITAAISGTTTNYYILTQNLQVLSSFSTAPLVGGAYINVGDSLTIQRPDGSSISLKVKGWMNEGLTGTYAANRTEMLFIEDILHGPDTKYTLGWHNCYSFGNGVESNRIRDTYNLPFIANGVKASTTLDENPYEEQLKYGLIYSGIYNSNSSVNNLNQFIAAEKITKEINPTYGSIQKLKAGWGQGGDLITLCEDRVLKILANKDALFNADGNKNLTSTNNVLGQAIPYSGEYGISTNPESFASEAYRAYFTDKVRGAVMRLSMDGLTPISNAGMKDWFRDNLKLSNKLIGSYDDRQDEYNISLQATTENVSKTVSYKEDVKGWVSFKSFAKETGISCANGYYTFANGRLWEHHTESAEDVLTATITGVDHAADTPDPITGEDRNGKYFFFELSELESIFPLIPTGWTSYTTTMKQHRNSTFVRQAVVDIFGAGGNSLLANSPSGGDTKGHGRLDVGSAYFQWEVGDTITIGNWDRNTFYDTFTNSSLNVLLNDMPSSIKSYHTLEYEGSQSRVVQNLQDDEYYNLTDKDGWHVSGVETNKEKGSLLEFIEKEGKWFNYIKGLESNFDDIDFGSFEVQGLGIQSEMVFANANDLDDGTVRIFIDGGVNCSLQVGDAVYYQLPDSEEMFSAGVVVTNPSFFDGITGPTQHLFQVDMNDLLSNTPNDPGVGSYWMFVKNQVVNMNGLSGYYADARFENNSKVKAELFAVSSEITESSK